MKLLQLFRANNLIIIILTQCIVKYYMLTHSRLPDLSSHIGLSYFDFSLLVLATVIIGAAGYLINDYFDYDLDLLSNRRNPYFSKKSILRIYIPVVILGLLISLYLAIRLDLVDLFWFYPIATVLLFFYSSHLKTTGIPANILVSLFTAGVVGIVLLSEYRQGIVLSDSAIAVLYAFMIFAFLVNFYREIIKDMEDSDSDKAFGLNTMPIQIGIERSKIVSSFIGAITLLLAICFTFFSEFNHIISLLHVILFIILPIIFIVYRTLTSSEQKHFSFISLSLKILMIAGITFLLYP